MPADMAIGRMRKKSANSPRSRWYLILPKRVSR